MNHRKSVTLFALLGAALMLGCALVPFTIATDGAQETDAKAEEYDEKDLLDLFGALREQIMDFGLINLDGILMKPVNKAVSNAEPLPSSINGIKKFTGDKTYVINSDITFTKNGDEGGEIIIGEGAMLQVFPLGEKQKFTLFDKNGISDWEDLVTVERGSYLNIFGMTLEVVEAGSDKDFDLFGIDKETEDDMSCTFEYDNTLANNGLKLKGEMDNDPDGHLIFCAMSFTPGFEVKGKLTSAGINGISITDATMTSWSEFIMPSGEGEEEIMIPTKIGGTTHINELTMAFDTDTEEKVSGRFVADLNIENNGKPCFTMEIPMDVEIPDFIKIVKNNVSVYDLSLRTGNVDIEIASKGNDSVVSITASDDIKVKVNKAESELINDDNESAVITRLEGADATLCNSSVSLGVKWTKEKTTVTEIHIVTVPTLTIKSASTYVLLFEEAGFDLLVANDIALNMGSASFERKDGIITASTDKISLTAGVTGVAMSDYDNRIDLNITNFILVKKDGNIRMEFDISGEMDVPYDGKIRKITASAENLIANFYKSGRYDVSVKSAVLDKDVPNGAVWVAVWMFLPKVLGLYKSEMPDYLKVEVKNAAKDKFGVVTADLISVDIKNYDIFTELHTEMKGKVRVEVQVEEESYFATKGIRCEEIVGSYKNIGGSLEKFSITNGAVIDMEELKNKKDVDYFMRHIIHITHGDAKFGGGVLAAYMSIEKDANFTADGVTFASLTFKDGCKKSGTTSLRSITYRDMSGELLTLSTEIKAKNYELKMTTRGFFITLDLSDMTSGSVTAERGCIIPANYEGDGYKITSKDGKTGDITISPKGAEVDMKVIRNAFVLSYEDDFMEAKTYRYLDEVTITDEIPKRDGLTFVGWTDGLRDGKTDDYSLYSLYSLIGPGETYIMPPMDVVLRPVFMKTVTAETVTEEGKTVLIVDASNAEMVQIKVKVEQWDTMKVTLKNVVIEFDKKTYDQVYNRVDDPDFELRIMALFVDKFYDEYVEKVVGEKKICGITLMDNYGTSLYDEVFSGKTTFNVTINMKTASTVKDFDVNHFDPDYGFFDKVGVKEYKRCNDGSYNVTFTVNHFSMYSVEPVYKDQVDNMFALAILLIAIVVICAIIAGLIDRKKHPE